MSHTQCQRNTVDKVESCDDETRVEVFRFADRRDEVGNLFGGGRVGRLCQTHGQFQKSPFMLVETRFRKTTRKGLATFREATNQSFRSTSRSLQEDAVSELSVMASVDIGNNRAHRFLENDRQRPMPHGRPKFTERSQIAGTKAEDLHDIQAGVPMGSWKYTADVRIRGLQ
jgi:hypothetical protein